MNLLGLASAGLLLALAWLMPNHYPPWLSAYADLAAAASVLALGVTVTTVRRAPLLVSPAASFFVALAAVPLVQVAFHQIVFLGDAWVVVMYLLCAAACVAWSAQAARLDAERWSRCLAAAILAGALFSCVILAIQRLAVDAGSALLFILSVAPGHVPFANLGQPNHLATLLALGLAALLFLHERGQASAPYATGAAIALTLALVVTQSRTAFLFWIVAIAWHWRFARRVGLHVRRRTIVALALGWLVLFPLWPTLVTTMGFENLATAASRLQAGPRTVLWPQMVEAIGLHPWFGYGWNQVSFAQLAIAAQHPGLRFTESAHNLFLDLTIWNGVPLAALISVVALTWLVKAAMRARTLAAAFALLLIVLILCHAMVEFPLEYLYFLVPFAMAIGILSNEVAPDSGWRLAYPARIALPVAFASVATLAAIDYAAVEENYRDMRFAVAHFGKAMPSSPPPFLQTQFTQLAAFHHFSLTTPSGPLDSVGLQWMHDVAYRYPYAPSLYRYALAQALSSDISGAQSTLQALRNMYGDGPYGQARAELLSMSQKQPILGRLSLPEASTPMSVGGAGDPGR